MSNEVHRYDIYNAIAQLEEAATNHNATFDEANKIFSDTEKGLSQINLDCWYPYPLSPRLPGAPSAPPNVLSQHIPLQPFTVTTYKLGYISSRLVIRKVNSEYDYERDAWGNVFYGPNYFPYTKKISDNVSEPICVADSSRELRVMVIESLPMFLEFVRSFIATHTQTLNWALGNLRST
ncbi:hypothetical protein GCM10007421_16590 [Halopseudomonas oceani]|uniref:Uncharacterized protein n=1 Tax=Halopseudomonas oceani TaxID=1708783 RepID=A0A2P4ESL9_9GAMM|nr:hypothetical protein [Halopseudomonas oceani]POB02064.1 hypothetical protein C1949_14565 [Halopseudomonas oceani]GGE43064.1 hypothetical protein GCM10007421_16590 [Halopseudomonas oceani]